MDKRIGSLAKLLAVHGQLKTVHETRRAAHLAEAAAAAEEALALVARFDAPGTLSGLFPEIYHARIAGARRREEDALRLAAAEAERLVALSLREKKIAQDLAVLQAAEDRRTAERQVLDWVETRLAPGRA